MTPAAQPSPDIRITRIYNAPRALVWEAWTDLAHVEKWWGPRGYTLTTHSKTLRVGGEWHYTMHGPDGTDYENTTKYLEIAPLTKLVYDHGGHRDRPPLFRVTVVFSDLPGGKTKMDMISTLPTPEAAAQIRGFIRKAGGESTWDRLAEHLEKESTGTDQFIMARTFGAPRAALFNLWTDPKHLTHWLPPVGFTMEFLECEIRTGCSSFYVMGNDSTKMYGIVHYLAVERPQKLVYTQQFVDAKKRLTRHPFAPTWPETMLTTVEFSEDGPEYTRVTITWKPQGPVTEEELQVFIKMKPAMMQAWASSFEKLEAYLEKA